MTFPFRRVLLPAAGALLLATAFRPCEAADSMVLGLEDVLEIARAQNIDIANAALEKIKAAMKRESASRSRLPEFTVNASYTHLDVPETTEIPIPGFSLPDSEGDIFLQGTLPLYTGGRITASRRLASFGYELAAVSETALLGNIEAQAAAHFFRLIAAQEGVSISLEALETSRRHLKDVNALFDQGLAASVDRIRGELDLAERERDLAAAEAERTIASESLSALIFPEKQVDIEAAWVFPPPVEVRSVDSWLEIAEEESPDIAASRLSVALASAEVAAARAEKRPTLSLFGAYGAKDEQFTIDREDRYWSAGLVASWSLFSGGRKRIAVERSRETHRQSLNNLTKTKRAVRRGIVEAHALSLLALRQFAAANKAIEAAEENLRITDLKYQQGLVPNTDVIDAMLALSGARYDRVQSMKNYHTGQFRLRRLAGLIKGKT